MATSPNFVETPKNWACHLSAANSNRDGTTGTYVTLLTGAPGGSRVERIQVRAQSTVTNGMIRFFVKNASGTPYFYHEIQVVATTPSATAVCWSAEWKRTDGQPIIDLAEDWIVTVSTEKAELFDVLATFGGDHGT